MTKKYNTNARAIAITSMVIALNIVILLLAGILPTGRLGFLFLSALFVAVPMVEGWTLNAVLSYIATGLLAFLLLPNKGIALAYILLFGHYGIIHQLMRRIPNKPLRIALQLVYFNAAIALAYLLTREVFFAETDISGLLPWIIIGVQALFFLTDYIYEQLVVLYIHRFRNYIIK